MLSGELDGSDRDYFFQKVRSEGQEKNGRHWRPFFYSSGIVGKEKAQDQEV
jgi:hypothetical protein